VDNGALGLAEAIGEILARLIRIVGKNPKPSPSRAIRARSARYICRAPMCGARRIGPSPRANDQVSFQFFDIARRYRDRLAEWHVAMAATAADRYRICGRASSFLYRWRQISPKRCFTPWLPALFDKQSGLKPRSLSGQIPLIYELRKERACRLRGFMDKITGVAGPISASRQCPKLAILCYSRRHPMASPNSDENLSASFLEMLPVSGVSRKGALMIRPFIAGLLVFLSASSNALAQSCTGNPVAVQILGSGAPGFVKDRANTSYVLWIGPQAKILVDAGGGAYVRFGQAQAKFSDLSMILVSHLHPDHAADFPGSCGRAA
jgi:hypothetical protein